MIAVSALYLLYLLTVPIVAQGFNAKKALFSGGQLSSAENNLFGAKSYQVVWEEFPRCKVYEAEDNVFDVLHIKKPPELQADIVFAAVPYFACSTAAMAEVFVFYFTPDWPIVILAQIPLLAFVLLVMDQRRISQRRRLEGHA